MSNPWFRMYSEFATDPKVQMLSEAMQRRLMMIMCMRCSNTLVTLQEQEIAFQLRITDADLAETKALFISKGFVDSAWNVRNWEKRQFASDTSKARVAKHRLLQKEKQSTNGNGDVTLQKQNDNGLEQNRTDTDTDTKEKKTTPAKRATPKTQSVDKPDCITEQTWADWLQLRKTKKAPVTQTVLDGALSEAEIAGIAPEEFLKIWCLRGSQGLEASWLKPQERNQSAQNESFAERDERRARERIAEATGTTFKPADMGMVFDISSQRISA